MKKISNIFNWNYGDEDSRLNNEESGSKFSLANKKRIDAKTILKSICQKKKNKSVVAHININSLRNKFELLFHQVKGIIDVLMISETKIDDSFPLGNFHDSLVGGILLYDTEDIPTNLMDAETTDWRFLCRDKSA